LNLADLSEVLGKGKEKSAELPEQFQLKAWIYTPVTYLLQAKNDSLKNKQTKQRYK